MILLLNFFRVLDWLHLLGLAILGYLYAGGVVLFAGPFLICLLISALYLAYGYSLNQCYDHRRFDQVQLIGDRAIPLRKAFFLSFLALIIALCLAYKYSLVTFILVILGGLSGVIYSATPFRLKGVPYLGLFCDALCFVPLFLIGYAAAKRLDLNALLMSVSIFFLFLPIDLIHQLNDASEDRAQGYRTTAIALGARKTLGLITLSFTVLNTWIISLVVYQKIHYSFLMATILFSIVVLIYLFQIYAQGKIGYARSKLKIRYFAILYGLGIAASIYLAKP